MRRADIFERDLIRAGLEMAAVGLCVLDHTGVVVMTNTSFCRQFLLNEEETVGRSSRRLLDNRSTDAGFLLWLGDLYSESDYRLRLKSGEGDLEILLRSKTLAYRDGERFKVICSIDVTPRRDIAGPTPLPAASRTVAVPALPLNLEPARP